MGTLKIGILIASAAAFVLGVWTGQWRSQTDPQDSAAANDPSAAVELSGIPESVRTTPGFADVASIESPAARRAAAEAWITEIAHLDPRAALRLAEALPIPSGTREKIKRSVFAIWAETDPEAAAEEALKATAQSGFASVELLGVAEGWARADPGAALAWAGALEGGLELRIETIKAALHSGLKSDLEATAEAIKSLPRRELLAMASVKSFMDESPFDTALLALGESDPAKAFEWLQRLDSEITLALFTRTFGNRDQLPHHLRRFIASHHEEALEFASNLSKSSSAYRAVLAAALGAMGADEFERAWTLSDALPPSARGLALQPAITEWTKDDPTAVFRFLIDHPEIYSDLGSPLRGLILRGEASLTDIETLIAEAPEEKRLPLMEQALDQFAHRDPEEAMAAAIDHSVGQSTMSQIVKTWILKDRDGFEAWFETQPDPIRPIGLAALANASDPETASGIYTELAQLPIEDAWTSQLGFEISLTARSLAERDLSGAAEWLLTLGGSEIAARAAEEITRRALTVDAAAASEWIARMERGPPRDEAVEALASHLAESDPSSAFTWATTIDNIDTGHPIAELLPQLYRSDAEGLISELEAAPPSGGRDYAAMLAVERHSSIDPERSFALAASIHNDQRREQALRAPLEQIGNDRERAGVLIESLPDTLPDRAELLRRLDDNRYFPF